MRIAAPWLGFVALLAAAWMVFTPVAPRAGGSRDLMVMLVNATQAPSEAARACSATFRAAVRRAGEVELSVVGETPFLRLVGRSSVADFLEWPRDALEGAVASEPIRFDTVIVFDCVPEERKLDVLVRSRRGISRLQLRDVEIADARVRSVAMLAVQLGWNGFSP